MNDEPLSDEMRQHLEEIIEELVASGLTVEQATLAARRRFGNRTSLMEQSRDVWARPLLDHLLQDLRYAARTLVKSPLFAAAVVLPLALGMGANTAIFTVVDAALLRTLPYRDPQRLVHLWEFKQRSRAVDSEASYPDYLAWNSANRAFDGVAAYNAGNGGITLNDAAKPEQIEGASASLSFFPLLGTQAAIGRTFVAGEDRRGGPRVVMLADSLWRRRFHADPAVVGRTMLLNNRPFTIVGVLPRQFQFAMAGQPDVWLPLIPSANQEARGYWHWLNVIARLKPGATMRQGREEMASISARIAQSDPGHHAATGIRVVPLQEEIVGQVRPVLLVLMGTIGLVLLLACANVANLILSRSAARQREIAVRGSLGASRGRLVQQLLTESLLLALLGAALGLAIAHWGIQILTNAIPSAMRSYMPYFEGLTLNWRVMAFTAAVSLFTAVAFGIAPALRISRAGLQAGRRSSAGGDHRRLRSLLLVAEVAISVVLLVGAGLMMKSTLRLLQVNPGFNPDHLLTVKVSLPGLKYAKEDQVAAFHQSLIARLEASPGIAGAASVSVLPLSGGGDNGNLKVIERPVPEGTEPVVNVRTISAGYFHTMGIPLQAGRDFTPRDDQAAPRIVIVNQRLAHQVFPDQNPVGQRVAFTWSPGPWQIAGVVADENTVSLDVETRPVVYFPYLQGPGRFLNLVIRSTVSSTALADLVRQEVRSLDSEIPVYGVVTMEQLIADAPSTFMRRYPAFLIGVFAAIALLLAALGTYGLVAYTVAQRTQEIGIRIALGARPGDILRLVMGQGLMLVSAGLAIGMAGAALLARALSTMLFGVRPMDFATFVTVAAVLGVTALLASYVPAQRAIRIAPTVALNG